LTPSNSNISTTSQSKIHPDAYGVAALDYGMVMLGACVGCDEFVKRKLEEHVLSLEPVMESLIKMSLPSVQKLLFTNSQFQTQLRVRLYMEIGKLREGTICDCKRKTKVDKNGHHFMSGCGMQGLLSDQHDAMVLEISHMAGYCGLNTRREPLGCFRETDPDCGKKPDLVILNPMISELLLEISRPINFLVSYWENLLRSSRYNIWNHRTKLREHEIF
jgi:hypothetical protein